MKIRLAVAAAAALAAPILLPASHALASTTHVASPAAVSHVNGGCGCGCGGCFGGGFGSFGSFGGGCGHCCGGCGGGFGGFVGGGLGGGFSSFGGGCGHCGCGGCGFSQHFDVDVSIHPCFNPCFGF